MAIVTVDQLIDHFGVGRFQVGYLVALAIVECADGIEILTLSLLSMLLECEWHISASQAALITTLVFLGMIVGALVLSNLADRFGRKPILLLGCSLGLTFGLLSAMAPNLYWIYFLRMVLGAGAGGILVITTSMLAEISPRHFRAKAQMVIFGSWAIGSLLVVAIAYLAVPHLGWRWFLALVSLPLLIGIIPVAYNPESLRYLVLARRYDEAMAVVSTMARQNRREAPEGPIDMRPNGDQRGSTLLLFQRGQRCITGLQMVSWFVGGLIYYGAVMLSASLPAVSYPCLQDSSRLFLAESRPDTSCCTHLSGRLYASLAIAAVGDMLGSILDAFVLDRFGRRAAIAGCGAASCLVFAALDFCMPLPARNVLLLVMRCFTVAFINGLFVYTAELYPTAVRSSGIGLNMSCERIGGLMAPFLAQVLVLHNTRLTLFLFSGLSLFGAVIVLLIPKETANAALTEQSYTGEGRLVTDDPKPDYRTFE